MPVIRAADATDHLVHGTRFTSYARPGTGSTELCAWRVEFPGRTEGVAHRVSREEVFCLLDGTLRICVDDEDELVSAGDVVVVPAGARVRADNPGDQPATAWVTTGAGFGGVMADGTWFSPPWTR